MFSRFSSPDPEPATAPERRDRRVLRRSRYVAASQQVLALGLVLAALTPAARTVTMDVRPAEPGTASTGQAAYLRAATVPAQVPTAPIDPEVTEYELTARSGARVAVGQLRASSRPTATGETVTSDPVPVLGYAAVGVTWQHGLQVADDTIGFEARTFDDGAWSDWTAIDYHEEHAPDPDSQEARDARPGTDPLLIGEVDEVQVRIAADDAAPADLKLAVIDPGQAEDTARELPDIDTSTLPGADSDPTDMNSTTDGDDEGVELQAQVAAPKPKIFSRAQWGADERMRDKASLHYYEVHAGFVHHTVNANNYTRAQVPGIIRGIYAYHTQSLGWSDIGYNFLVDRFGRIWEGRAGGVARPVVGAHTLGYNDNSFAMSAIGNYETARPSAATLSAYGALFAWKLGLHGVNAKDTQQYVTSRNFQAINGHRDAGSTACPGRYLYAKLGRIRALAASQQQGWSGRDLESSLIGDERPDLVFRRKFDGRAVIRQVIKGDNGYRLSRPTVTNVDLSTASVFLKAGDWDLDGKGDLLVRHDGALWLHRGLGRGRFAPQTRLLKDAGSIRKLAAVGDFTGDGRPDLMGQPKGSSMRIYPGNGTKGVGASYPAYSALPGMRQYGIGRWDGDGAPDTLVRTKKALVLYLGNGPGGLSSRRTLDLDVTRYDWLVGVNGAGLTGHSDVIVRDKAAKRLWLHPGTTTQFLRRSEIAGNISNYDRMA